MPRRDLNVGGKVYLSHGEESVSEAATDAIVRLRIKDFSDEQNYTHAFFSTFSPDVLLE